jgi:hypothetical protein
MDEFQIKVLGILDRIAAALEEKNAPMVFVRALSEFKTFDWAAEGFRIVQEDPAGPTLVEFDGQVYKRYWKERDGQANGFWYARPIGKKPDGSTDFLTVLKFRAMSESKPLPPSVQSKLELEKPAHKPAQAEASKPDPAQAEADQKKPDRPKAPPLARRQYLLTALERYLIAEEAAIRIAEIAGLDPKQDPDYGPATMFLPYFAEAKRSGLNFPQAIKLLESKGKDPSQAIMGIGDVKGSE